MSIHRLKTKSTASAASDVDLSAYVKKSGARMTGRINMGSKKITELGEPTDPRDAATAKYVGDVTSLLDGKKLDKSGGSMTGDLALGRNKITGLGDATENDDAATKGYTDRFVSYLNDSKVNKIGDTMTGPLDMSQKKLPMLENQQKTKTLRRKST